jgi:hypothetical protein
LGRADAADPSHKVHLDLSDTASAASVSRNHINLRYHDNRNQWFGIFSLLFPSFVLPHSSSRQILVCGRNGVYDEKGKFFPPSEHWIDLAVFPEHKFEVCWVKFELQAE